MCLCWYHSASKSVSNIVEGTHPDGRWHVHCGIHTVHVRAVHVVTCTWPLGYMRCMVECTPIKICLLLASFLINIGLSYGQPHPSCCPLKTLVRKQQQANIRVHLCAHVHVYIYLTYTLLIYTFMYRSVHSVCISTYMYMYMCLYMQLHYVLLPNFPPSYPSTSSSLPPYLSPSSLPCS